MRKSIVLMCSIILIVLLAITLVACMDNAGNKYTLELVDKDVEYFVVTQATTAEINKMKTEYIELAKTMKVSLSTVTDAAEAWLRTGMDSASATQALQASIVLSTDAFMDSATATQYLVAAQKAYKLEAEDLMGVVDKLAILDSKAATTAADLGESLSMSASSAGLAGISMDKYLAILATTSETTQQSASTIGNAWKTILARLQQVKLGKAMDEEGEDISNVDTLLKEYNIDLMETTDNLENMEKLLDVLGQRWQGYTAAQKSEIATIVAGTRQRDKLIATLNNYDRVLELTKESMDSNGKAMQKYNTYADSTQAKIEKLKTGWTALVDATVKSDSYEWFLDMGNALMEFGEKAGGLIPIILDLAGAWMIFKGAVSENYLAVAAGIGLVVGGTTKGIVELVSSSRIEKIQKEYDKTQELIKKKDELSDSMTKNVLEYVHLNSITDRTIQQDK